MATAARVLESEAPVDYPARAGWMAVGVLWLFYVFAMIDRQVMTMLVDPIRRDLGINDIQASYLLGLSFALFYTTIGLPMGWLIDRYSRRTVLAVSVALWGVASASCGLAHTFPALFLSRMLVGIGEAALGPAVFSMLADSFPKKRLALPLSVYTTGALFGGVIAMFASGLVIQLSARPDGIVLPVIGAMDGWRTVFLLTGIPGPLLALLAFSFPEPQRQRAPRPQASAPSGELVRFVKANSRLLVLLFLGFGAMNMILSSGGAWTPTYLRRAFALKPVSVGLVYAGLLVLGAVPGQIFSGWYVNRMVRSGASAPYIRYFLVAIPVALPFGIIAFLSGNVVVFFVTMLPFYFVFFAFMGIASTLIQVVTPGALRGRVSALFLMVTTLVGLGAGPTLVAAVAEAFDGPGKSLGAGLVIVLTVSGIVAFFALAASRTVVRDAIAAAAQDPGGPTGGAS